MFHIPGLTPTVTLIVVTVTACRASPPVHLMELAAASATGDWHPPESVL